MADSGRFLSGRDETLHPLGDGLALDRVEWVATENRINPEGLAVAVPIAGRCQGVAVAA